MVASNNPVACRAFAGRTPKIHPSVFVAENAVIVGDVEIAEGSSVWYGAVLRGDVCPIRIGKSSNIQDGVIIHGDEGRKTVVGDNVTVGHRAIVHGCRIEDGALIGMGAIILDGATIGASAIVGAGSLVAVGKQMPPRTLWVGSPARLIRDLDEHAVQSLLESALHYRRLAQAYVSLPA
ncbi:gamma carbonic anhydrase family protein [Shinella sp. PSBB067]|uniref:gamma carbonic anhydrase family protein n=1 Tax=Shinella sp. PSBB067 TaxID=2715959 RepID=UPI00193BF604|nr:gamma carbonic anhydrase family protein [Shinella sp. PSBB067]QRI62358.1 gamma carbonic anhydrase family protein [Shinella sp. PSBB067]